MKTAASANTDCYAIARLKRMDDHVAEQEQTLREYQREDHLYETHEVIGDFQAVGIGHETPSIILRWGDQPGRALLCVWWLTERALRPHTGAAVWCADTMRNEVCTSQAPASTSRRRRARPCASRKLWTLISGKSDHPPASRTRRTTTTSFHRVSSRSCRTPRRSACRTMASIPCHRSSAI
jgi:hypothetical protein